MTEWNNYLESLCQDYAQYLNAYTLTDVVGKQQIEQKQSLLLLDFMVQTVQSAKEDRSETQEKIERLDVLAGLRKYAQESVLLVGRPGSGKSTALVRLLLEEAERGRGAGVQGCRGGNSSSNVVDNGVDGLGKIPILVELRYYQTSVLDLIRNFLKRHCLLLETATIEQLLFNGQFLLLVDGINELPSEKARQDLYTFRQDYQKTTPMIFTTRDLGVGGDLGITKKLEMQPLTAEQMQQFVHAYLPKQGEQMLQKLGDRLREFGETPLLLLMLCSLFQATGDIPDNLGLVFRQFTQSYERQFRHGIPVTDESRRWWTLLLKHLAFHMTTGDKLTELNVAIPRSKAEDVLTQFLQAEKFDRPRDRALQWLQDLLNHHLIQLGANDQIEFRHQLIQEYYTAECLLKLLSNLSDDCLQREYLNYLKWTEPLKLMLGLMDDEAQVVQVVKLALDVDWQLGAKLAGAVKPELQQQTVNLVAGLEVSVLLKIRLLGLTKYNQAYSYTSREFKSKYARREFKSKVRIPKLNKLIKYVLPNEYYDTPSVLEAVESEEAVNQLIELLEDDESDNVRCLAAYALSEIKEIKSEKAINKLIELVGDDKPDDVRYHAVYALGRIKSEKAVNKLIELLGDDESDDVRYHAAYALGEIRAIKSINRLIKLLEDDESDVRDSAEYALVNIKSEKAIPKLTKLLRHKQSDVRRRATFILGEIKEITSEQRIHTLIELLKANESDVRHYAASALGQIESDLAILHLVKLLTDKNSSVRSIAASALVENNKSETALPQLINLLKNEQFVSANNGDTLFFALQALERIQENCQYYKCLPEPKLQLYLPPSQLIKTSLMYILHLSDLHFGTPDQATPDQAKLWSNQLATDLQNELDIPHLDALILSGDIANKSTPDEYQAAQQFLNKLSQRFSLEPEKIIIVPGNHDLNWSLAKKAYQLIDRDDYKGELKPGEYIEENASVIRVRDEENYKKRFEHFSNFYQIIKNKPYPLDYDQQYTLDHFPNHNLLILGLNSAWQLDHHYKSRASININALSNALDQILDTPEYKNCLKIAVWHHPVNSSESMQNVDFLQQLAVNNFQVAIHGHIHEAKDENFQYDTQRGIRIIAAGTFGAPAKEQVTGIPLQYNLLTLHPQRKVMTIETRKKEKIDGAWSADARWGDKKNPVPRYDIQL